MKTILLSLALVGLMSASSFAADSSDQSEIRKAQKARIDAVVHADRAELETVLADDLTYVHSSGALDTKKSYIDSLLSKRVIYEGIETSDLNFRKHGNTWVLTAKAVLHIKTADRQTALPVRITEVYVKHGDHWQLEAYQSTRLPETK